MSDTSTNNNSDSESTSGKHSKKLDLNRGHRKRKQPDNEIANQLADFRTEFMADFTKAQSKMFSKFTKTITDQLSGVRSDILELKEELAIIKKTNQNITHEQNIIKNDILQLKNSGAETEKKVTALETDVQNLKIAPTVSTLKPLSCEEMVAEFRDRCLREKNIIILGITEATGNTGAERYKMDREQVFSIISKIYEEKSPPEPLKVSRVGKYAAEKNRPIKVSFEATATVKHILRNRSKCDEQIKIHSDQTRAQYDYLKHLRNELKQRQESGESNLSIRFIKGSPRIIKEDPLNLEHPRTLQKTSRHKENLIPTDRLL